MSEKDLFTGERFLPGINDIKLEIEHYQRYLSVQRLVKDKIVLDAACGEGYGSDILAKYAKKVIGIDLDNDTITRAKVKYKDRDNLIFIQGNIEKLEIEDCSIDIVISFETIEHVSEDIQKNFLNEIDRVLKNDGIMVMSTPNKRIYSDLHNYNNEFHIKEFYHKDFLKFLHEKFQFVQLYNQSFKVFSVIDSCNREEDDITYYSKDRSYNSDGKYYIAIASHKEIEKISLSCLYVDNQNEYEENIKRILTLQKEEESRNQHIQKLDEELHSKEITIQELQKQNSDRNEHIKKLDGEIQMLQKEEDNRNQHIQKLDEELHSKEITIQELQKQNSDRNEHIKKLDG
ncbi:MAG: methyltransferase domain-containing protein, partial [Lachnospiraceae bacterium]